ncbi:MULTISPECIES: CRISPR-associated endoribonuclease Cas6 [Clostridium]|uniref:CRISPR-associated endoribonuclease Cas6 n=1 Tax=Clostridium TaxID=1485 RepID=UPI000772D8C8|nr:MULTISPECIES: CRISPR-associated endoribonuclease Cas6 [Clostridium]NFH81375.1 CRISPR-associated endoribonuclease Cas6 [Clostridium botulinum]NFH83404.1 CRISPR-associated endoribonuclease Cas6 [Clostridium botulinum]NFI12597.1 CRISPR-associated endoribonuclease Cas6 [Clostridium botulinum]NFI16061.1 CRISPR-associated endoribonuclease Cas6 [Clostridium botulinum]NFO85277.1 CRISPR-associated endoribonuclease Cas6 [Clostridium botulinum]
MNFIELTATVMLKKDIYFADGGYIIGKNINKLMLLDEELKELHPKKEYKHYVFNNFYPLEKDKFYKKDKLYVFKIRGLKHDFMQKVHNCLQILNSDDFKVISVASNEMKITSIKELYTVTPVIITIDNKPWLQHDDLELFKDRLEANLEKKYKDFFDEDINIQGKFIKNIIFKNRMPMGFSYKSIKLLGNKVGIEIQENDEAQKIAFVAMGAGLGEKNSAVGAGFCNWR